MPNNRLGTPSALTKDGQWIHTHNTNSNFKDNRLNQNTKDQFEGSPFRNSTKDYQSHIRSSKICFGCGTPGHVRRNCNLINNAKRDIDKPHENQCKSPTPESPDLIEFSSDEEQDLKPSTISKSMETNTPDSTQPVKIRESGTALHNLRIQQQLAKLQKEEEEYSAALWKDQDAFKDSASSQQKLQEVDSAAKTESTEVTLKRKRKGKKGRATMYDLTPHLFY